jgi:hypothetical protein
MDTFLIAFTPKFSGFGSHRRYSGYLTPNSKQISWMNFLSGLLEVLKIIYRALF